MHSVHTPLERSQIVPCGWWCSTHAAFGEGVGQDIGSTRGFALVGSVGQEGGRGNGSGDRSQMGNSMQIRRRTRVLHSWGRGGPFMCSMTTTSSRHTDGPLMGPWAHVLHSYMCRTRVYHVCRAMPQPNAKRIARSIPCRQQASGH
jgi:hypothetical protein